MIAAGLALDLGASTGLGVVVGAPALVGAGNGLVLPQLIRVGLAGVETERAGIGSAMLSTAQQLAGAVGVALVGGGVLRGAGGRRLSGSRR